MKTICVTTAIFLIALNSLDAQDKFTSMDVFDLEWVSDPRISPDGEKIIYVRNYNDVMNDRSYSNLWIINFDGSDNRPLTTGNHSDYSPRWMPDGKKLVFISDRDGTSQIYMKWIDNGAESKLTNTRIAVSNLQVSPDGSSLAFAGFVEETAAAPFVNLPSPPQGAKWITPPKYISKMNYRLDGSGYARQGQTQLFILPVSGGAPHKVTSIKYQNEGDFCWSNDGNSFFLSANGHDDFEFQPLNYEIYEVSIDGKSVKELTKRNGPDAGPAASPDGKWIAYTGFDDKYQGYQVTDLYVMNRDGSAAKKIISSLDRDVSDLKWSADGKIIYFKYDDRGNTILACTDLNGKVTRLADNLGGLTLDRPYGGSSFTVSRNGRFAYTLAGTDHPSDLAVGPAAGVNSRRITNLNDDLFRYRNLGRVEEIVYSSSFDDRKIQGWLVYPPDFDTTKKYPLVLEIHGGPFDNYGPRFSVEMQLYAAKGYVVLYTNPRGSTGYGEEFGNLIDRNYPGNDYDDLMSGVDFVLKKGFIDEQNLFVTGGSGGGVLTAWIVGHTDRFRAAVSAKPIVNWYSLALYGDLPAYITRYWFKALPWDDVEEYMKRSPVSYVKNVHTPTMILTGEQDYRTPISEIEQFYTALKLNRTETAMVRIQEAGHGIADRPSNEINKTEYTLAWFEKYRKK